MKYFRLPLPNEAGSEKREFDKVTERTTLLAPAGAKNIKCWLEYEFEQKVLEFKRTCLVVTRFLDEENAVHYRALSKVLLKKMFPKKF